MKSFLTDEERATWFSLIDSFLCSMYTFRSVEGWGVYSVIVAFNGIIHFF